MYIVAIGWLYVVLMMAVTEKNIVSGVITFLFYGLIPCSVVMWLLGAPGRGRKLRKLQETTTDETTSASVDEHAHQPDSADPKRD